VPQLVGQGFKCLGCGCHWCRWLVTGEL
jgi:hypothetical protein